MSLAISNRTRKALWANSRNRCAFTGCKVELAKRSDASGGIVVRGDEAHIRGRGVAGPRHDPDYADVDGYDNLILLCAVHHRDVDANGGRGFSVDELRQMKANHERVVGLSSKVNRALTSYLGRTYEADDYARFDQVDLQPRVDPSWTWRWVLGRDLPTQT